MKLTKEEIQFIDNYLIKNEVKFWDVRLELLDHIVSAVEDKIEHEGISFNEALLNVHQGFGNRTKVYGIENNRLMKHGLYADNTGFKNFTRKKQKELGRKYRKLSWKHYKSKLLSPKFIIEYIAFIICFYVLYSFFPKISFLAGLLVLVLPTVYSVYYSLKDKSSRKSLSFIMATSSGMLVWTLYNLSFYILKDVYGSAEAIPKLIFVITTCVFYPSIRTTIEVYKNVYQENKEAYNLKVL